MNNCIGVSVNKMYSRKSEYMYRWIYEQNMSADLRTKCVGVFIWKITINIRLLYQPDGWFSHRNADLCKIISKQDCLLGFTSLFNEFVRHTQINPVNERKKGNTIFFYARTSAGVDEKWVVLCTLFWTCLYLYFHVSGVHFHIVAGWKIMYGTLYLWRYDGISKG
jgi:hypothetical protein